MSSAAHHGGVVAVNADRLWDDIMSLAEMTETERPWTRRSFSPEFMKGRAWLEARFREAQLETRIDAGGNLIGKRPGEIGGPPIVIGSHSDTVPAGGRFDGILGVLAGLEVIRALNDMGEKTNNPIEVIDFLAEEPSEFGLSCIGSRILTGAYDANMMETVREDGKTLGEAVFDLGGDPTSLSSATRHPGDIAAFFELHIEQGPVLENSKVDIGAVTGIAGIRRYEIVVAGQADHSGTTPMDMRFDALTTAARIALMAEAKASREAVVNAGFVMTIGRLENFPNAANSVPGRVCMTLEMRSGEDQIMDRVENQFMAETAKLAEERKQWVSIDPISATVPAKCSEALQGLIAASAQDIGLSSISIPSGAGHDAAFLSRIAPTGMIFVPCRDGRSHGPEEWAEPNDCANGAAVLLESIRKLNSQGCMKQETD